MTEVSRRFEQMIRAYYHRTGFKNILPVKTEGGIVLGDVMIVSRGSLKDIEKSGEVIYKDVSLNDVAIYLAHRLLLKGKTLDNDKIYAADQDYGKWIDECHRLKILHRKAVNSQDIDRADLLASKLKDRELRAEIAKRNALGLIKS